MADTANIKKELDNIDDLAKEIGLTEKQKKAADYYVFVTDLDAEAAVELAGYSFGSEKATEDTKKINRKRVAYDFIHNVKVLRYISQIRELMSNQIIVDKLWVINKLKTLAESGSENTQIRALELLGKTMQMYADKQVIENVGDPAKIAKEAFKRRQKNVVEFKNGTTDV